MCATMTAHHLPCTHTRHWHARCFVAKLTREPFCRFALLRFSYSENFLCPECMVALKCENGGLQLLYGKKKVSEKQDGEKEGEGEMLA